MEQRENISMGNRIGLFIVCLLMLLFFATNASAFTIMQNGSPIDVGGRDTVRNATTLKKSGYATEENWVKNSLGSGYTVQKFDFRPTATITNNSSFFAFSLPANVSYFYINTGNVNSGYTHFLYANVDNLNYGIVSPTEDWGSNANYGKFSHYGIITRTPPPPPTIAAPLPATVLLLGSGLLGVVGIKRRVKK